MNTTKTALDFMNFDLDHPRERFTTCAVEESGPGTWSRTHVMVFDRKVSIAEPVYEYHRNYTMASTFEPFRLFVGGQWRYYALISPLYTNFEVLDLQTYRVVAKNPYPKMPDKVAEMYNDSTAQPALGLHREGDPWEAAGFCPMEFHVPDVMDIFDAEDLQEYHSTDDPEDRAITEDWVRTFIARRTFGFVSGSVWDDDWSMKIRDIDLSRVPQGKVTLRESFGYFVQPDNLKLADCYSKLFFHDKDVDRLWLTTPVSFTFDQHSDVVQSRFLQEPPAHFTH